VVARALINIKHVGMPNLLAEREIVPEFIQWRATAENIARPIVNWIKNISEAKKSRAELLALRKLFGEAGASDRAARVILENMKHA
jgi:lipid-A-disaccharide synthase